MSDERTERKRGAWTPPAEGGAEAPSERSPGAADPEARREGSARAADPRERILATTVELLGEVGWAGITTRSVAGRAKVNNALVHYYFGSMSRLRTEAAKRLVAEGVAEPMAMLADPDVPVSEALAAAVTWLGSGGLDPAKLRALVEVTVNGLQEPELAEFSKAMVLEGRAALTERLEREGLEPARARGVATLAFALLDGLMVHLIIDPSLPVGEVVAALEPVFRKEPQ